VPTFGLSSEVLALKMDFWRIFQKFKKIYGGPIGGTLVGHTGSRIRETSFPTDRQLYFAWYSGEILVKISNADAILNFEIIFSFNVE
jgi:hypothetical protein